MYRGRGGELDGRLAAAAAGRRRGDAAAAAEYERLFREKVRLITEQGGEGAAEVSRLATEVVRAVETQRELDDALDAGRAARGALMAGQDAIGRVGWQLGDAFLDLLFPGQSERRRIGAAVSWLSVATASLSRFRTVLQVMEVPMKIDLDIELERLVSDLAPVREQARGAPIDLARVRACHRSADGAARRLGLMLTALEKRRDRLAYRVEASRDRLRREVEGLR
jgi:hypothetical protein